MSDSVFKKSEMKNGIRVLTESHKDSRAVSIGLWVLTGTRDEIPAIAGISHFLEHLVFKGTKTRNAYQIAKSLEALGGELNAYTTREYTCFHAMVLKDHWTQALDVLCDLVSNMDLSPKEFKLEKGVILQEIAMAEDNEEDIIYDHFLSDIFPKNPLGRPILGTNESIVKMKKSQIEKYYRDTYTGENIIVGATGDLDHQVFLKETEKHLGRRKHASIGTVRVAPKWKKSRRVIESSSDQIHMLMGFPTASYKDKHRFHGYILNTILGGGMTSRLYQSVREKKGLVYSIHSSLNTFVDCGQVMIYASADPKKTTAVMDIIFSEMKKLKAKGIKKAELDMFKTQITGNVLLGSDDLENRMSSISINEMVFGKYRSVEKVISEIQEISLSSMNEYIEEKLDLDLISGVLMGNQVSKFKDDFCSGV